MSDVDIAVEVVVTDPAIEVAVVDTGARGPAGEPGADGADGVPGLDGADGVGVPPGGTTGQVLAKVSDDDFDTGWSDVEAGGGGDHPDTDHDTLATTAALTTESAARAAGDAALDGRLDTVEADYSTSVETAAAVAAEATARAAAVTAEATARANADALLIPLTQKAAAGGVATLDGSGLVPDGQIPGTLARDVEVAGLIQTAIDDFLDGAPGALDTLNELAAAIGDDANFAATITTALAAKQPLDPDLTAIAALTTTSFGRSLLELASAATGRTLLGLGTAALSATGDFDPAGAAAAAQAASQPLDSDLTAIAALTTTAYGRALLALADAAAGRTALGLGSAAVEAAATLLARANHTGTQAISTVTGLQAALDTRALRLLRFVIDGGGSAITTGAKKAYLTVPFTGVITKARLVADVVGSIVLDVWKDSYANFPPTVADTITASAKPTLAAAQKAEDSTLTGWTTAVTAGDVLEVNVDSAATVTRVFLDLFVSVT